MIFYERVAFAACFLGYLLDLHLGEMLRRSSGVNLPRIFRSSPPFYYVKFPQVHSSLKFTLGGVLRRLETILSHIHGFSTDT